MFDNAILKFVLKMTFYRGRKTLCNKQWFAKWLDAYEMSNGVNVWHNRLVLVFPSKCTNIWRYERQFKTAFKSQSTLRTKLNNPFSESMFFEKLFTKWIGNLLELIDTVQEDWLNISLIRYSFSDVILFYISN